MKKILFISAPRWNEVEYATKKAMGGMADFPPIGMLHISSYLKQHCDVQTRLFDYNLVQKQNYSAIDRELEEFQPDLAGLTTYTFILFDIYEICRRIKERSPGTKIVLGGKHAELFPYETLAQDFVDYLVLGEGEHPMRALVDSLEAGRERPLVPGLWFKENGRIRDGGWADRIKDLDSLPFPDLSILTGKKYRYRFESGAPEGIMVTSRGCPYGCKYCMSANSDRIFAPRSPENVVAEMRAWGDREYGVINFFDDNFNTDIERAKQICRLLIENGPHVAWTMRGSPENIDEDLAALMASSGCRRAILGIESANEEVLSSFGRRSSNSKIRETFERLDRNGIGTAGYFMLGFPGETREMVRKTIDFALSLPLDFAQFSLVFPAPGSPFYLDLVEQSKIPDVFRAFSTNPTPHFSIPYFEDPLTRDEITALCRRAYSSFYFRPGLVLRHLRKLKSARELMSKAKLAIALAGYSLAHR